MKKVTLRARAIINALTALIEEFDESKVSPNVVLMTYGDFESIRESYPYLIDNQSIICNNTRLNVIFTAQKSTVGVALAFYTDFIEEYANGGSNESP